MEAKARQTDIKMTARKLRRVINEVRGKSVVEAQDMLRFMRSEEHTSELQSR